MSYLLEQPTTHTHYYLLFFFTTPAPTEISTLSLHDALPICADLSRRRLDRVAAQAAVRPRGRADANPDHFAADEPLARIDRKSTRLNSSHTVISYAVFCLKKKKKNTDVSWTLINSAVWSRPA